MPRKLSRRQRALRKNKLLRMNERVWIRDMNIVQSRVLKSIPASVSNIDDLSPVLRAYQNNVRKMIQRLGQSTGEAFAQQEVEFLLGPQKSFRDTFRKGIADYYKQHALEAAVTVTESLREKFRKVIARAGKQRSRREIAQYIRDETNLTRGEAERIARTEAHTASQRGAREGAKATGLPLIKRWLSAERRVRPTHAAADGQERDLDKPYSIGGHAAMHPGDPKLPAKERINCRCQEMYDVKE